jgi:hydrophobe/amphiphile efflux-1 (HAE1) family protein
MSKLNIPAWCIDHPIGTMLLSMALVLLGIGAYPMLPVASLPEAEFPTISINAQLPGASAETIASAVATPLEIELSNVAGITEITSNSILGSVSLTLQFELDKSLDTAVQEVQAALNAAARRLPADMNGPPTWRKVNPGDNPVLMLAVSSDSLPLTAVSELAETVLARQISRIDGVGEVSMRGLQRPAIRIQASPETLAAAGLTLADIRAAVQRASVNRPKGSLHGSQRVSTLAANDQMFTTDEYGDLIVAYRQGVPVHLRDVANVHWGAENEYQRAWTHGETGVLLIIRRQPGANVVKTVDQIYAALPQLQQMLPATVQVRPDNDRTRTIRSSLHEVELTLIIAVLLVLGVMAMFLRQLSATLIVAAVLGVTLIATGAGMYLAGFSLNNLTLVAIIIAISFVVDDAIVVVENIHRYLAKGFSQREAALRGVTEISGTVISISLSLVAAFIPLLFMGGVIGRLFREFAVTATMAIMISVVVSLTLAPTLAALFMRPMQHGEREDGFFAGMLRLYDRGLGWALAHQRSMLTLFVLTVSVSVACFIYIPKGFFPLQDTGLIQGSTLGAPDISYDEMVSKHEALEKILAADPDVVLHSHSLRNEAHNVGSVWLTLSDPGDRSANSAQIIDRLRPQLATIPGLQVFLRSSQDINIGAGAPRAQFLYVLRAADSALLTEWAQRLTERLAQQPALLDVSSDIQAGASITRVEIDRRVAARFGISVEDIDQALYDAFGQRQINEIQTESNQYKVILGFGSGQRGNADSLAYFHLRSPISGEMIPLSALVQIGPPETGPLSILRNGLLPATNISFNLAPGIALDEAVRQLREAEQDIGLPAAVSGSLQGAARAFEDSLSTQVLLIFSAIIALYIILGVLYESFIHPITILSTLPSAGIGAFALLWLCGHEFSIMALVGLILLIGIVKKNGILMIDFALDAQRRRGLSAEAAVREACLTRFRPILMTTLAAAFGALPLMLGFGTGSELRQPLGIAVVGGLAFSQLLTLFTTPVIYVALDRWFSGSRKPTPEAHSPLLGEAG